MAYSSSAQEFQYIQDILKEFFAPAIVNQVYKKAPLWAQIKKTTKGVYGKKIIIPVSLAFSQAVGSRVANTYTLPTSKRSTFDQAEITMKRNYGRIQIDGFAIESAKGKGGWVDIVSAESKNIANSFAVEIDRQTLGTGDGVMAHVVSDSSSALTIDNPRGVSGDTPVDKFFKVGMVLDIHDVSDNTKHVDGLEISSISAAGVLTLDASTGLSSTADGDLIFREDVFSATATNIGDMMGIDGIVDSADHPNTSSFQAIDRDTYDAWQAYESSTSQVISETVIQEFLDSIEKRTDGEAPTLALTTYALRNKLINLVRGDRMVTTMDLKAGWKAIKYVGGNVELPIMVHKNLATGYFYALSIPHIKFYTLKKLVWDNKGGGVVKPVAGYDAYEAWFKMYGNIGTDMPNTMGKLTGLTTS